MKLNSKDYFFLNEEAFKSAVKSAGWWSIAEPGKKICLKVQNENELYGIFS